MLNKPFDKNSRSLYYTSKEKSSKLGLFVRPLEWCYPLNYVYGFCFKNNFKKMLSTPKPCTLVYKSIAVLQIYFYFHFRV